MHRGLNISATSVATSTTVTGSPSMLPSHARQRTFVKHFALGPRARAAGKYSALRLRPHHHLAAPGSTCCELSELHPMLRQMGLLTLQR